MRSGLVVALLLLSGCTCDTSARLTTAIDQVRHARTTWLKIRAQELRPMTEEEEVLDMLLYRAEEDLSKEQRIYLGK